MMTTEHRSPGIAVRRDHGFAVLFGAAAATGCAGLLVSILALMADGTRGLYASLLGTTLVIAGFLLGALLVNAVASIQPGLSLLVALVTYLLQVVLLGLTLVILNRSGLLGEHLSRGWLGGAIMVGTMVWLAGQLVLFTRRRIPIFDLPEGSAR